MNKTEAKILDNALELYNTKGIDSITVRHIADHIGIRHSNITYYFPKKDDIIDVLYHKMQGEIDEIIEKFEPSDHKDFDLSLFADSFDVLYSYRFVHINHAEIFKRVPELKEIYKHNKEKRYHKFKSIANDLQKSGILKDEAKPEQLDLVIYNIVLTTDFWIVYADLNESGGKEEQKKFFLRLILNAFFPVVTDKGKKMLDDVFKKL